MPWWPWSFTLLVSSSSSAGFCLTVSAVGSDVTVSVVLATVAGTGETLFDFFDSA